jgi:predicted nuclease of predicted toxin-antitoxin system
MRIKLDENLSRHLKGALQQLGHDAETAWDEGLCGRSDGVVAEAARRTGRMVFTLDLHFSDFRKYPPGQHPGIVLFRPRDLSILTVEQMVVRFVGETEVSQLSGCLVVVQPGRIRVRRPA